jgi:hypothetical protein
VVTPVLADAGIPEYLDDSLCDVCAKLSFLLAAYAKTAGVPFRADLAALGGAVARVYDDLVDRDHDADTDRRLTKLFAGTPVAPRTPRERLLHRLYQELEARLGRDRDDPIYAALTALHDEQVRSRHQRDPAIQPVLLADITLAKGGHAMVVLLGLVKPAMTPPERAVGRALGEALQLLDDYLDVSLDRRDGITTAATRDELSLGHICRRLRALRPALVSCYGRAQPLTGVLYVHLWWSFLRRTCAGWPAARRPFRVLVRWARRHRPSRLMTDDGRQRMVGL